MSKFTLRTPLFLALCTAVLLVAQSDRANLAIKPGLWEETVSSTAAGDVPISDQRFAQLSLEQRAQVKKTFQAIMAAQRGKTHTYQVCLTPQQLAAQLSKESLANQTCKWTPSRNTTSVLDIQAQCTSPEGMNTAIDFHFTAASDVSVKGTAHATMTASGRSTVADGQISAKWLASSCGNVK